MDDQRGAVRQLLGAVVAEGDSGGRWIVEVRQVVRVEDHAPLVGPGVTHRGRPGGATSLVTGYGTTTGPTCVAPARRNRRPRSHRPHALPGSPPRPPRAAMPW